MRAKLDALFIRIWAPQVRPQLVLLILLSLLIIAFFSLAPSTTHADESSSSSNGGNGSLAIDGALGYHNIRLENPNGTSVYYTGVAVQGRALFKLFGGEMFRSDLFGNIRYLELDNTANNSGQKEVGSHVGPGAGISFGFYKLFFGVEYDYMIARHYAVGAFSKATQFQYNLLNAFAGLSIPRGQLGINLSYSMGSATISKSQTNLTKDTPYSDQIFWLHLVYNTGSSLGGLVGQFFK